MPTISDEQLREALTTVLRERHDLIREVLEEIVEDAGMLHAIRAGETGQTATEAEVMKILQDRDPA